MSSKPDAPSPTLSLLASRASSAPHRVSEPTNRASKDQALEDLASELVGRAANKWRGRIPEALLRLVASRVRSNLITTSEGRTRLQRCFFTKPTLH